MSSPRHPQLDTPPTRNTPLSPFEFHAQNADLAHVPSVERRQRPVCVVSALSRQERVLFAPSGTFIVFYLPISWKEVWRVYVGPGCRSFLGGGVGSTGPGWRLLLVDRLPVALGSSSSISGGDTANGVPFSDRLLDTRVNLSKGSLLHGTSSESSLFFYWGLMCSFGERFFTRMPLSLIIECGVTCSFRPCLGRLSPGASASGSRASRHASQWTTPCRLGRWRDDLR